MSHHTETRAGNKALLGQWPAELTSENVAAWIRSNAGIPVDVLPMLHAMIDPRVRGFIQRVKSLKENLNV